MSETATRNIREGNATALEIMCSGEMDSQKGVFLCDAMIEAFSNGLKRNMEIMGKIDLPYSEDEQILIASLTESSRYLERQKMETKALLEKWLLQLG